MDLQIYFVVDTDNGKNVPVALCNNANDAEFIADRYNNQGDGFGFSGRRYQVEQYSLNETTDWTTIADRLIDFLMNDRSNKK
ncbi:MAG: hypothetical protein LC122_14215 [Chitinophagales bacterium]|nr:hypothetical protein [Chitinophagales bacterium]